MQFADDATNAGFECVYELTKFLITQNLLDLILFYLIIKLFLIIRLFPNYQIISELSDFSQTVRIFTYCQVISKLSGYFLTVRYIWSHGDSCDSAPFPCPSCPCLCYLTVFYVFSTQFYFFVDILQKNWWSISFSPVSFRLYKFMFFT